MQAQHEQCSKYIYVYVYCIVPICYLLLLYIYILPVDNNSTTDLLMKKWRGAFAEAVTDCSQQVFDLFVNDYEILKK